MPKDRYELVEESNDLAVFKLQDTTGEQSPASRGLFSGLFSSKKDQAAESEKNEDSASKLHGIQKPKSKMIDYEEGVSLL